MMEVAFDIASGANYKFNTAGVGEEVRVFHERRATPSWRSYRFARLREKFHHSMHGPSSSFRITVHGHLNKLTMLMVPHSLWTCHFLFLFAGIGAHGPDL